MGLRSSAVAVLWRWPVRALVAHVLFFAVLLGTGAVAGRDGGLSAIGGLQSSA